MAVAEVRTRRGDLDGTYLYDPIAMEDSDPSDVAWLTWRDGVPKIYSHAHGGAWYRLQAAVLHVPLQRGCEADAVDGLAEALRLDGNFFVVESGAIVHVTTSGQLSPRNKHSLTYDLSRRVLCTRTNKGGVTLPQDIPQPAVDQLLSVDRGVHHLPLLQGVITAPTMRQDGSVLDKLGYDAATGLFLFGRDASAMPSIPNKVSEGALEQALLSLWKPFRAFAWGEAVRDVGVMLAALLTAVVRPLLPTAPGFGFSAPMAGSGKTLLMQCVATLAAGKRVAVQPPVRSADEVRKRLYTSLLCSPTDPICWDNLQEPLGGESLDAFLTSAVYSDRNLGTNTSFSLPNKALFMVTGRNVGLRGDTNRRVALCRIDPRTEQPYLREFAFDPLEMVERDRLVMVAAALTVIKWGRERSGQGKTLGSYEAWSAFVSKPLSEVSHWLETNEATGLRLSAQVGLPVAGWTDPAEAIDANMRDNEENNTLGSLLDLVSCPPFSGSFTVRGLLQAANDGKYSHAEEVVQTILGESNGRAGSESRRIANWLRQSALRVPHGGRVIKIDGSLDGSNRYCVTEA